MTARALFLALGWMMGAPFAAPAQAPYPWDGQRFEVTEPGMGRFLPGTATLFVLPNGTEYLLAADSVSDGLLIWRGGKPVASIRTFATLERAQTASPADSAVWTDGALRVIFVYPHPEGRLFVGLTTVPIDGPAR